MQRKGKIVFGFVSILISVFFAFTTKVYSQTPTPDPTQENRDLFNEGFKEYQQKFEDYNKAHEDYSFYRAQYQKFNTLASKQDMYEATKKMLQARDDVVIAYFKALDLRLGFTIGISDTALDGFKKTIAAETQWFSDHRDRIGSAGTLEDLIKDSNSASVRFNSDTAFFYQLLGALSYGKVSDYTDRTGEILTPLKDKLEQIRSDSREGYSFSSDKFQALDRWIFDADSRMIRSGEKLADASIKISSLTRLRGSASSYNAVLNVLGEAQLYLKETTSYMKEVIRSVKTGE